MRLNPQDWNSEDAKEEDLRKQFEGPGEMKFQVNIGLYIYIYT